ncbi:hypothetical protein PBI_ELVA_48 [Microbacterium phage Elva]|uniref:hypothetical protein n=1 Tax=Microbacterium phage Elva TaxID=2126929 RepID=UPI000D20D84A|nr:hypothetical protein QDW20_gp48 [Microbacterium phage Elva]AVR56789.1 hypothetical protein PBI_ELVA_48 [Microbacterium phage Elva]
MKTNELPAVGSTIQVEVINRMDPLYGVELPAVVTKHTEKSAYGIVEVWWEVPGVVDHMGLPRFGAQGCRVED